MQKPCVDTPTHTDTHPYEGN